MTEKLLVGLIGAGILGSRSPALHQAEAAAQGLHLSYQLFDLDAPGVGVEALPRLLDSAIRQGYRGLNITFPCKQAVMPLLDEISPEARTIGAVNTVVFESGRRIGHNTDGRGWAWGFQRALHGEDLSRVVLLGAGGAGAAVGHAVLAQGAHELQVFDLEAARAGALRESLATLFPDRKVVSGRNLATATGLIHATPVGMAGHPGMPVEAIQLHAGLWVSEVVYVPLDTALLQAARRAGCRVMDGGHMNVGQAALAFRLFTGREADASRMEAHFRKLTG